MPNFFKAFRRTDVVEEKAEADSGFDVLYQIGGGRTSSIVTPQQAYNYYTEIPALGTAVDIVAWAFLQIPPVLRNRETGEILHKAKDHALLNLLAHPGRINTGQTLAYDMIKSFLLCNEVYPVAVGTFKSEPVELYILKPNYVTSDEGDDGWVQTLDATAHNQSRRYVRDTKLNPYMWTFTHKNEQTVQFSTSRIGDTYRGDSVLNAIQRNLDLVKYGLGHNVGLLENGGRPSGLFSPSQGTSLSKHLYKDFINQISKMFRGFQNAGRIIAAPIPVDYKNFMTTNRDMDFAKLLEQSRNEIFARYGIPLPYISEKVMTMSNFTEASTAVYDSAVLPRAKFIYRQLGEFLLPRYKDGSKFELGINETKLPALQQRLADRLRQMYETHTFTVNERRSVTGLGSIDGGDTLYLPANLFPMGDDLNPEDILGG
jgi:HK97 family phage portal protein